MNEKESDKLLTSQDTVENGQNGHNSTPTKPQNSPKTLGVQKRENLTVSSASHSSLSRPSDIPQLLVTEIRNMKKYRKNNNIDKKGRSYIIKKFQTKKDDASIINVQDDIEKDAGDKEKTSMKRRVLKVAVTIMFLIMAVGVIVIWSLHDGGKENKLEEFFFFHSDDLYLKTFTEFGEISIEGTIGGPLFIVPDSPDRDKDTCEGDSKWCFIWKEKTKLLVDYVNKENMKCVTASWVNITTVFPTDCYKLKMGYWYGMGGKDKWPMNNRHIPQQFYLPGYDEQIGNVYEFYLLSSRGTSLYITSEDPILLSFNEKNDSKLCISPSAVGPGMVTTLQYSICQSDTLKETHEGSTAMSHKQPAEYNRMNLTSIERFAWKIGDSNELLNVTEITKFIEKLKKKVYVCGDVEIDFKWEKHQGDFDFHPDVLTNLSVLKNYDCKFILPLSPVVAYTSETFDYGLQNELFVKDLYQKSVRLYKYGHIQGGLLDLSQENTKSYLMGKLKNLSKILNIASFKLKKVPVSLQAADASGGKFSISGIYRGWIDLFNDLGKMPILENVYRAQDKSLLVEVENSITKNSENKSCLHNPFSTVFTLGMDGYPYLMSTMSNNNLTAELLIRYLQFSTFFTRLTIPSEGIELRNGASVFMKKVRKFRDGFFSEMLQLLQPDISSSQPILLPLWWYYSSDANVFSIHDQFLFNKTILIAPIFCEGQKARDIYLPAIDGIWSDHVTQKDYKGNKWLKNYNVGLNDIPYFEAKMLY